nr:hypothetical protein CFP56_52863 [Quercus suber]
MLCRSYTICQPSLCRFGRAEKLAPPGRRFLSDPSPNPCSFHREDSWRIWGGMAASGKASTTARPAADPSSSTSRRRFAAGRSRHRQPNFQRGRRAVELNSDSGKAIIDSRMLALDLRLLGSKTNLRIGKDKMME